MCIKTKVFFYRNMNKIYTQKSAALIVVQTTKVKHTKKPTSTPTPTPTTPKATKTKRTAIAVKTPPAKVVVSSSTDIDSKTLMPSALMTSVPVPVSLLDKKEKQQQKILTKPTIPSSKGGATTTTTTMTPTQKIFEIKKPSLLPKPKVKVVIPPALLQQQLLLQQQMEQQKQEAAEGIKGVGVADEKEEDMEAVAAETDISIATPFSRIPVRTAKAENRALATATATATATSAASTTNAIMDNDDSIASGVVVVVGDANDIIDVDVVMHSPPPTKNAGAKSEAMIK